MSQRLHRPEDTSRDNYFVQHWRGDHSLSRSFWVNNLGLDIFLGVLLLGLEMGLQYGGGASVFWRFHSLLEILSIGVFVWQSVGLWRSARKHIEETESRFWPRAAQTLVVLGVLTTLATAPFYLEQGKIVLGLDELQDYSIGLSSDNQTVVIKGSLGLGVSGQLRQILAKAPEVWIVHLNSEGGYLQEGEELHRIIKEHGLATYTNDGCYSACTYAFVAGNDRIINRNAELGFHRSSASSISNVFLEVVDERSKQHFMEAGVDKEFVEEAFSVSGEEIWIPSVEELGKAGVITHVYDGSNTVSAKSYY